MANVTVPEKQVRVIHSSSSNTLTIREYMATQIYASIIASRFQMPSSQTARMAVFHADCLIHALNMDPQLIHDEFNPQTK